MVIRDSLICKLDIPPNVPPEHARLESDFSVESIRPEGGNPPLETPAHKKLTRRTVYSYRIVDLLPPLPGINVSYI